MIMNCQSHARSLWPPDFKSILFTTSLISSLSMCPTSCSATHGPDKLVHPTVE